MFMYTNICIYTYLYKYIHPNYIYITFLSILYILGEQAPSHNEDHTPSESECRCPASLAPVLQVQPSYVCINIYIYVYLCE
jgi:hypothetical protein